MGKYELMSSLHIIRHVGSVSSGVSVLVVRFSVSLVSKIITKFFGFAVSSVKFLV